MNLSPITANRPRSLLIGIAAGLLLGLGAVQGALAINEASNPGGEAPEKGAESNPAAASIDIRPAA